MAAAMEKNYTMLSFGYSFETRGPRDGMNRYILRNNDIRKFTSYLHILMMMMTTMMMRMKMMMILL